MATQVYEVPIIFHGARQPESFLQVIDLLDNLSHVVDQAYSRISSRVDIERARIHSLDFRLNAAQAKVQHITGTSKAITVLSSAKYPAAEPTDYAPLYNDAPHNVPKFSTYHLRDIPVVSQQQRETEDTLDASELLFMEKGQTQSNLEKVEAREGLGRLPQRVPSISSLLLFNSSENPYKEYATNDNLAGKEAVAASSSGVPHRKPGAAPETLANGEALIAPEGHDLGYRPGYEHVNLDFPSILPNLPGIADNIAWSAGDRDEIAPSKYLKLPEFSNVATAPTVGVLAAPAVDHVFVSSVPVVQGPIVPIPVISTPAISTVVPIPLPVTSNTPSLIPIPPPIPKKGPIVQPQGPIEPPKPLEDARVLHQGPKELPKPIVDIPEASSNKNLPRSDDDKGDWLGDIVNFQKGGLKRVNREEVPKKSKAPSDTLMGAFILALTRRQESLSGAKKPKTSSSQEDEEIRAPPKEVDDADNIVDGNDDMSDVGYTSGSDSDDGTWIDA